MRTSPPPSRDRFDPATAVAILAGVTVVDRVERLHDLLEQPRRVLHVVARKGVPLLYVIEVREPT